MLRVKIIVLIQDGMNKEHLFYANMTNEVAPESHMCHFQEVGLLEEKFESREIRTMGSNSNDCRCDHEKRFKNGNTENKIKGRYSIEFCYISSLFRCVSPKKYILKA